MSGTQPKRPTTEAATTPTVSSEPATPVEYLRETLTDLKTILGRPEGYHPNDRDEIIEAHAQIDRALARTAPPGSPEAESRPRRRGDPPLRPIGHGPAHPADQAARAFGRLLVAYREARGLSQRELAERLGWEQPNLARLEAGTHTPTLATLNRIAGRLGIEVILRIAPEGIDVETQERPM